MMASDGLATHWIDRLGSGYAAAAPARRERYFRQRVGLARKKVQDMPGRAVDQEDVALSAFEGFCRSAERGRYPQRRDRDMPVGCYGSQDVRPGTRRAPARAWRIPSIWEKESRS